MSFAVWLTKPPFDFGPKDAEQAYEVGDKWVVTDDPKRATQAEVDAVLNAPLPRKKISDGQLGDVLVKAGVIPQAALDAAALAAS